MREKNIESNAFLDIVALVVGFFYSLYRSMSYFFGKTPQKRGIFFKALYFVFQLWPKYFWKEPKGKKIGSFLGDFIRYVFYNTPLPHE